MRVVRSIVLIAAVCGLLGFVVLGTQPAEATCESCQERLFNPDICWPDLDGYTKCVDTGPGCQDEHVGGSVECDQDGGGDDGCEIDGSFCPPECSSCYTVP